MVQLAKVQSRQPAPALDGARILVVEDDFLICLELETILADAGAKAVVLARTVADGLKLAGNGALDAAILDVRIGGKSVAPVARGLAARGLPFLFYTGQVETDPIRQEWPECRIVAKPARAPVLVNAVAELIDTHAGERSKPARRAL